MRASILCLALWCGASFAQAPSKPPSPTGQKEQADRPKQSTNYENRGTGKSIFVISVDAKIAGQESDRIREEGRKEGKKESIDDALVHWTKRLSADTERLADYTIALALFTLFIVVIAGGQLWMFRRQLNQMEADGPGRPRVVIRQLHMWDLGAGALFGPQNSLPNLMPGDVIEVAACAANMGGRDAILIDSNCVLCWLSGGLTMNHPIWSNKTKSRLQTINWLDDGRYDIYPVEKSTVIAPGGTGRWQLSTQVPADESCDLYVLGIVTYQDRLKIRWVTSFARKYNKITRCFEVARDFNYEEAH